MFQDEARFGRISDVRRCWCPKPLRPMVRAMVTQEYVYAYAALSPADGRMDSLLLPDVNGACMQIFLDEVAARHRKERIVMIVDGAGWHKNQELQVPYNMRLLFLPPYAPELNPVEYLWGHLKTNALANLAPFELPTLTHATRCAARNVQRRDALLRAFIHHAPLPLRLE